MSAFMSSVRLSALAGVALSSAMAAGDQTSSPATESPPPARLVDRLLASYAQIERVTCQIRRETVTPQGRSRFLSTVYWQRDSRMHVDNVEPLPRTIVADGTTFFSYVNGDPKGFSRPISKLDSEMSLGLKKVPGTAMEHLLLIGDAPEKPLPAEPDLPVRVGYTTPKVFAVLGLDVSNRLARVELFTGPDMATRTARYDYSRFTEVLPGVWIPQHHEAALAIGGTEAKETTRVDRLTTDPIAPNLFNASLYFPGIKFEDDFKKIYGS